MASLELLGLLMGCGLAQQQGNPGGPGPRRGPGAGQYAARVREAVPMGMVGALAKLRATRPGAEAWCVAGALVVNSVLPFEQLVAGWANLWGLGAGMRQGGRYLALLKSHTQLLCRCCTCPVQATQGCSIGGPAGHTP